MISKILTSSALLATALAYPAPPSGGVGVDSSSGPPSYVPATDFDLQSFLVGLNQEWLELDLFHNILASFSEEELDNAGIDAAQRYLIQEMAEQEVGHAEMISNIIAGVGVSSQQCSYKYPYTPHESSPKEALAFAEYITRFGEEGVYGFLSHLDSRPIAQLVGSNCDSVSCFLALNLTFTLGAMRDLMP